MIDKNTNIFDLVEEVNKNKNKSSISTEKEINDIYSMLDEIKNDNNVSIDEVREKINNHSSSYTNSSSTERLADYATSVKKPELPGSVSNYHNFSECVLAFIAGVDYGSNNAKEYVNGHKEALEKYIYEIKNNAKDLYIVEINLNKIIDGFSSKSSLRDKGYYDGLVYVLKALLKAKEIMTESINNKLLETIC